MKQKLAAKTISYIYKSAYNYATGRKSLIGSLPVPAALKQTEKK